MLSLANLGVLGGYKFALNGVVINKTYKPLTVTVGMGIYITDLSSEDIVAFFKVSLRQVPRNIF